MNVNGLSNAGFMGGLMQGAQFVEGMQNRTKANDRADAQADRAQESHDQTIKLNGLKIDEAETKKLQSDFGLMTRKIRLTGEMPSKEEFKKFKPFGVDKLLNSNYIEENQNAGAAIHKARTTGEWGGDAIKALNTTFFDKLREKEKNTGEKHRVVDAQDMGDGRFGLMLEITGKDGKKRIAPLTKNGTADKDDNLVLFDESKMDEIHQVQLHRANMAYLWEKNKNDPKAAADFLDGIVFPAKAKKAPGLESIYDKETGGDQKVVWNGSQYVPIGGVKADNGKGGRGGGGGGGGGSSDSPEDLSKEMEEYRKRAEALGGDLEGLADAKDTFYKTTGFEPEVYEQVVQLKIKNNDQTPVTREELQRATYGLAQGAQHEAVEREMALNPDLFGEGAGELSEQQQKVKAGNEAFWQQEGANQQVPAQDVPVQQGGAAPPSPTQQQQGLQNLIATDAAYGELGQINNKNNTVSTEYSITENVPELGGWVNIPTLVKGQNDLSFLETGNITPEQRKIAINRAIERVKNGASLPSYNSLDEAVTAAEQRTEQTKMKPYNNKNESGKDPMQQLSQLKESIRQYSPANNNMPKDVVDKTLQQINQLQTKIEQDKEEYKKPILEKLTSLLGNDADGLSSVNAKPRKRTSRTTPTNQKIQKLKATINAIDNAQSQAEIQEIVSSVIIDNVEKNQNSASTL